MVELTVALAITALLMLVAHQVVGAVMENTARLQAARWRTDRHYGALRFLRTAFSSLEARSDSTERFVGHPDRVRFSTWLPTANGWLERQQLELRREGERWTATAIPDTHIELGLAITDLRFDYLLKPGEEPEWVGEWESPTSVPLAVRVRIDRQNGLVDTLMFLVGGPR